MARSSAFSLKGSERGSFAWEPILRGIRFRHDPKEGAVACIRLMLRCLLVVTVALGLASAPLSAGAATSDPSGSIEPHQHSSRFSQGVPDHDHASPAKPAMGQICCHPGCIMAVVPGFADLATVPLPWVTIPIPADPGVAPFAPLGLDRPPKRT
jgi:hypothetical protein